MRMMGFWGYGVMGAFLLGSGLTGYAAEPAFTVVREQLEPGGYVVGRVEPAAKVFLGKESVDVGPKGEVVMAFDRNAPLKQVVKVCQGTECTETVLDLAARDYITQNVKGVPPKTVNPDPAQLKVMAADHAAIAAGRDAAAKGSRWRTAYMDWFALPITGVPHSSVFGSRRTYNGEERSWHNGYDLAAKTGTDIHAPADGTVRLARRTFMSGNLVMLDHGGEVTSVYAHLSAMDVKVGQKVVKGEVIGQVGTTGRSTGPHLHWGMYWKNMPIDPILWVEPHQRGV